MSRWLLLATLPLAVSACTKSPESGPGNIRAVAETAGRDAPGARAAIASSRRLRSQVLKQVRRLNFERSVMSSVGAALRRIGPPAVGVLSGLLTGKDVRQRRQAAGALGLMREMAAAAIPSLLKALGDRSAVRDPEWREDVVYAIGRIGRVSQPVVNALMAALNDDVAGVRRAAARVLGRAGGSATSAVGALIARLGDQKWSVRKAAAQALGKLGNRTGPAMAALGKAAASDEHRRVRAAAAKAMARIERSAP